MAIARLNEDCIREIIDLVGIEDVRSLSQVKPFRKVALAALLRFCDDVTKYLALLCNDRSMLPPGNANCLVSEDKSGLLSHLISSLGSP